MIVTDKSCLASLLKLFENFVFQSDLGKTRFETRGSHIEICKTPFQYASREKPGSHRRKNQHGRPVKQRRFEF